MQRTITFAHRTKKYVREFNLFENETTNTDPFDIRTAILSTRIYIVLLIISLSTLLIFNLMGTQPEIVTILNPSEQEYKIFLNKYGNQSSCPCSRITISYINFTSTTVNYHPICQSIFVSNDWIHHLFNSEYTKIYQLDFRALANNYFQLLATFCSHVKRSVNDTLDNFYLQTFLTPNVLLQNTLDTEINITSQFLRSSIANSVHQLLQLVRTTTRSNRLQTVIPLSTMLLVASGNGVDILKATTVRYVYSELPRCSCYSMTHCPMPSGFFNSSQRSLWIEPDLYIKPLVNVPGFSVECFPVDSLLQSTLECLYDSSCLNTIHTFIPSSNITGVHTLDISQTRFPPNTSVELLINQLFIIEWSMKANFSNYYAQCAPIRCTHTLFKGKEPLYIFIKLLSLYGGLTTALRFFVPRIIAFWRKRRLASTSELRPTLSFVQYLQRIWQSIRVHLIELNLFKTRTMRTDPFEFTSLKISTWFYLVLLISLTIIIVFFNWFTVRIDRKDVPYPTLDQLEKLYEEHPGSLQCPCNLIDIPHGSFISISPRFHPVCTSFFTTNEWIDLMGSEYGIEDEIGYRDIFQVGPKFFNSLQTFCKIMETIVSNGFIIFNQSALVTNQTLSRIEFMKRTQQLFEQFTSNTIAEAKQSLALIRSQTVAMYTNGDTDISWRRSSHHNSSYLNFFQPVPIKIGNCSCKLREDCKQQLVYYGPWIETDPHSGTVKAAFYIANMFLGCFATESLLQSSLECIFDSNCMGHIISARYENLNVTLLEQNSSRFAAEILLQTIIDEIMIEKWNENINYSRYYEKCAPKICTYFVNSRNNALYALTTIIGLFGGLSTVLRIIVPRVVTWIRNKFYRRTNRDARTGSRTLRERLRTLWLLIKKKVLEVNLFESEASWDNEDRRRQEIVTTRLYLLLLISSLIIMILYTAVSVQIRSFTKENPSREYFERFVSNQRYSPTLDCPCQNISIQYNSFISITPYYHQLCSSDFIVHNSMWINLIYSESDLPQYAYDDYRQFILAHFRLLFDLCTLAKDTFTDALLTFRSNTFINTRAQSPQVVVAQIDANINQFRSSIPQAFMRTLDFIQQIAQGNGLVSSSVSNWYPVLEKTVGMIFMAPRTYGNNNCSCATNSKCVSSATIDEWIVPGFRIGCYPLESLLQSTLECLYNLTCINKLKNKKSFSNMTIRALNSTLSFPNATVQSLVDTLMVDRWESNIDYEKYYQSCAPVSCTYVIRERANSIYIITVIIGSFGGLTVALKILAPLIIKLVRYIIKWRGRRVVPNIAIIPLQ